MFDKIIVAVLVNIDKKCLFEINERVELIKKVTSNIDNIEVVSFSGLLMNFLKENNANVILKDYEQHMILSMSYKWLL